MDAALLSQTFNNMSQKMQIQRFCSISSTLSVLDLSREKDRNMKVVCELLLSPSEEYDSLLPILTGLGPPPIEECAGVYSILARLLQQIVIGNLLARSRQSSFSKLQLIPEEFELLRHGGLDICFVD